jgi:class 3 adenylate cyclase/ActR/RegA family two-component response regulator
MSENFENENSSYQHQKLPVWVIEDDLIVNQTVSRSLIKAGYTCMSFHSGSELLQYIDKAKIENHAAIMLLDYLLDDTDAISLLSQIREKGIDNPFIIMTGYGDEKIAVELMKTGAMDYIIKEKFFIEHIAKVIRQAEDKIEINARLELSRQELRNNAEKLKALNQQINLQKIELQDQKAKTDKLLHTILPGKIAQELLEKGFSRPRQYDVVSILFADVIGFSDLAKSGPAIELVTRLDNYFYVFDEIMEQYCLEKIKTIGDCYMCAGGIPEIDNYNAIKTVLAGLKIQKTSRLLRDEYNSHFTEFRLRLGIHTGEVVAGVVGKYKFAYDIWGDAVNIASRIVEAGEKDKVNISEQTYKLVKDYFICTKRGEVMTKRNVPIIMYFVEKLKPEYAADTEGINPNPELMKELNIKLGVNFY